MANSGGGTVGDVSWYPLPTTTIGGYDVVTSSRAELARAMVHDVHNRANFSRPRLIFDINGHGLSLSETDGQYREALEAADVIHADGAFLVALSRWLADPSISERSATTDLLTDFADAAAREGFSFYLLGGTEEVNRQCAEVLVGRFPGLQIAGRRNGFFSAGDVPALVEDISAARPDILWIGLGKPIEQRFAVAHGPDLGAAWVITCGGGFNFVTGHYKRAPMWMQRWGLEWLHRVASRPGQLFWRYVSTSPHAIWLIWRRAGRRSGRTGNTRHGE